MKKLYCYISGAAGFLGCNIVERLIAYGYQVNAIVRPNSVNNIRLLNYSQVNVIELDMKNIGDLPLQVNNNLEGSAPVFFHLAWAGERYDFTKQRENIKNSLEALEIAKLMGCRRFIATGTQAEYGTTEELIVEDRMPNPFCDYGAAKVATCYLSRRRAQELGIDWIWGRVFSLYGKYEPTGRMLPDLVQKLKNGERVELSSCTQNWDYLDAGDAAEALIALAQRGRAGEIYNIANGNYRPLKEYVEIVRKKYAPQAEIHYGDRSDPYVSLQPSVEKIMRDTGWRPMIGFEEGLKNYDK